MPSLFFRSGGQSGHSNAHPPWVASPSLIVPFPAAQRKSPTPATPTRQWLELVENSSPSTVFLCFSRVLSGFLTQNYFFSKVPLSSRFISLVWQKNPFFATEIYPWFSLSRCNQRTRVNGARIFFKESDPRPERRKPATTLCFPLNQLLTLPTTLPG